MATLPTELSFRYRQFSNRPKVYEERTLQNVSRQVTPIRSSRKPLELAVLLRPDLVILPETSAMEAARRLAAEAEAPCIIMALHDDPEPHRLLSLNHTPIRTASSCGRIEDKCLRDP
jgi:hypothetical protein